MKGALPFLELVVLCFPSPPHQLALLAGLVTGYLGATGTALLILAYRRVGDSKDSEWRGLHSGVGSLSITLFALLK